MANELQIMISDEDVDRRVNTRRAAQRWPPPARPCVRAFLLPGITADREAAARLSAPDPGRRSLPAAGPGPCHYAQPRRSRSRLLLHGVDEGQGAVGVVAGDRAFLDPLNGVAVLGRLRGSVGGARSSLRKPTYQHIFGSGETGVSALTPIATPLYCLYESVDIWCRSRPGGKENDPYTHDKICDPVERCPCAGPYGSARGLRL